ncbi:MAG: hypothetical protein PHE03_12390 [Bacteroidales bacterium]|nr:hypothetical protein [Bacteroidales bacterium]MDD3893090.1 hypothetical protein [Bacteroidales bacterium]
MFLQEIINPDFSEWVLDEDKEQLLKTLVPWKKQFDLSLNNLSLGIISALPPYPIAPNKQ